MLTSSEQHEYEQLRGILANLAGNKIVDMSVPLKNYSFERDLLNRYVQLVIKRLKPERSFEELFV